MESTHGQPDSGDCDLTIGNRWRLHIAVLAISRTPLLGNFDNYKVAWVATLDSKKHAWIAQA